MSSISKLSKKCRKCHNVKSCSNKRIEACAFIKLPEKLSNACIAPSTSPLMAPVARVRNPVTIKMGDYGTINTSLEEIKEKIEKQFYGNAFDVNCSFNKSLK